MLYSCSLEWVDVLRPLGVHMSPNLEKIFRGGTVRYQADFTRGGGTSMFLCPGDISDV